MSILANEQLMRLFSTSDVKVLDGKGQVQNNPKLCPKYIAQFWDDAALPKPPIHDKDFATNGMKTVCEYFLFRMPSHPIFKLSRR